jgi:hypothetical protein
VDLSFAQLHAQRDQCQSKEQRGGKDDDSTIPKYGLSACPRVSLGATNNDEIAAVTIRATPNRLTQCRVRRNQPGVFGVGVIANFPES